MVNFVPKTSRIQKKNSNDLKQKTKKCEGWAGPKRQQGYCLGKTSIGQQSQTAIVLYKNVELVLGLLFGKQFASKNMQNTLVAACPVFKLVKCKAMRFVNSYGSSAKTP